MHILSTVPRQSHPLSLAPDSCRTASTKQLLFSLFLLLPFFFMGEAEVGMDRAEQQQHR